MQKLSRARSRGVEDLANPGFGRSRQVVERRRATSLLLQAKLALQQHTASAVTRAIVMH